MKNFGLIKFLDADVNSFTSDMGLKIRKIIAKPLKILLKIATPEKIHVIKYPQLKKNEPYIFVSNHGFSNDIISALATIDRSVYLLMGSTNQVEYNKLVYAAWVNGFIYVNRLDPKSRADALPKMKRVLDSGTSILIFPEGGHNNTENLLCSKFFAGVYYLAKSTKVKVVPIAQYYEFGSEKIDIRVGNPIDIAGYENKEEALCNLRDTISTMVWENMEECSNPMIRTKLNEDVHIQFMEQRRQEYLKNPWTRDVWEEELTRYLDKDDKEYYSMLKSHDNIKVTANNADKVVAFLMKLEELKKYDFKEYMHRNWDKNI